MIRLAKRALLSCAALLLIVLVGGGCGAAGWGEDGLPRSERFREATPAPRFSAESAAVFRDAPDLTVTWNRSHGLLRQLTISIAGDGDAVVTSIDPNAPPARDITDYVYVERKTKLSREQLAELRRLISSNEFQTLPRQFLSRLADGVTVHCTVSAGGLWKEVYCASYFPKPIRRLAAFLASVFPEARALDE